MHNTPKRSGPQHLLSGSSSLLDSLCGYRIWAFEVNFTFLFCWAKLGFLWVFPFFPSFTSIVCRNKKCCVTEPQPLFFRGLGDTRLKNVEILDLSRSWVWDERVGESIPLRDENNNHKLIRSPLSIGTVGFWGLILPLGADHLRWGITSSGGDVSGDWLRGLLLLSGEGVRLTTDDVSFILWAGWGGSSLSYSTWTAAWGKFSKLHFDKNVIASRERLDTGLPIRHVFTDFGSTINVSQRNWPTQYLYLDVKEIQM